MRGRILSGEIAPGAPIRQDGLAETLGVSKIPVREALGRLEQDGLLSSHPNRGYVVRPMTADEAAEIFDLRLKIEPAATAEGARRATAAERDHAAMLLARLEAEPSAAEAIALNRAFHLALFAPCGEVTNQLLERLHVLAERYVRMHLEPTGRRARARSEHRALFEAWVGGRSAVVEALTASHIRATMNDLMGQLGR
ncbi:GntR family transcriptional regulator [Phenylobacterium montanum]|uniref:GntR family transcriptional regulator n=1 Tax=Phenylobacterium montanum TaxID=2823693 RepID=UPI002013A969|nr:GntR family transcriptional regulator [Caulobacter sp. S6]